MNELSKLLQENLNIEFKEIQRGKSSKSLIGVAVFGIACVLAIIIYGSKHSDYAMGPALGIVGGMFAFIFLIMFISLKAGKKKKGLPKLEKQLQEMLTTPELIEEFDKEMLGQPLWKAEGTDDLRITEHYLVNIFGPMGLKEYTFIRLEDIGCVNTCCSRDKTRALGFGRIYDVDI